VCYSVADLQIRLGSSRTIVLYTYRRSQKLIITQLLISCWRHPDVDKRIGCVGVTWFKRDGKTALQLPFSSEWRLAFGRHPVRSVWLPGVRSNDYNMATLV
jgi:hypothetical protein